MPNELFNTQNDQEPETKPNPNDQPSLFHVGEGKKYGHVEELDKAYGHANEHISKLEQELAEMRAKLEDKEGKDDTVDKILAALDSRKPDTDQQVNKQDEKPVEKVVEELLLQREHARKAKDNATLVREALVQRYGDKAADMYAAKGKELGIDLDSLAVQSARAVIELFGIEHAPKSNDAPLSGVDTSTFRTKQDDPLKELYANKKISREEYFRRQWRQLLEK